MTDDAAHGEEPRPADAAETVEVRRHALLLGAVAVVAGALAVAYVSRALGTGAVMDWGLAVLLAAIGLVFLVGLVDSRTPLLLADRTGVRARQGRRWTAATWSEVTAVEHLPRHGWWRDGRLVVHLTDPGRDSSGSVERGATGDADADASLASPAPLVVPLGLATRLSVPERDLDLALDDLSGGRLSVPEDSEETVAHVEELPPAVEPAPVEPSGSVGTAVPVGPTPGRWRDPRPVLAQGIARVASATPAPLRQLRPASRAEATLGALAVQQDPEEAAVVALPEADVLRREGADDAEQLTQWAHAGAAPAAAPDLATEVIEPVPDPVIGPQLAAARQRLSLSVASLSERTRIRTHVLECIEVDDFGPCGGDFYARGHLRTLARVLGVDVTPLLSEYDARYAHAPVSARQVLEAELATGAGGSIRSTRGGPHWSVLVAAAMVVVLVWSLARLVMDGPVELKQVPGLSQGSGGIGAGARATGGAVPVLLRAAGGGAHVTVRDGDGRISFSGDLAYGETRPLKVRPPVQVESSDGSVHVVVDGNDEGAVGETGKPATATYDGS